MSIWEYANPVKFMRTSGAVLPWVVAGAAVCTLGGLIWGFLTPDDYKQGASVKIMFLHVPAAMMAINCWLMMLVASLIWIVRRHHVSALAAKAAAPIGAAMTLIALVTGAAWGQPTWGTWWEWDPRLTSELLLLFLYLGVIGLYQAIDDRRNAARAAGLLAIVGVALLPVIRYSVEWWNSLHQGQTIRVFGESSMDASMLPPLIGMVIGTKLWFIGSLLLRARADNLEREAGKDWVRQRAGIDTATERAP